MALTYRHLQDDSGAWHVVYERHSGGDLVSVSAGPSERLARDEARRLSHRAAVLERASLARAELESSTHRSLRAIPAEFYREA
jgi:hypothetical protein